MKYNLCFLLTFVFKNVLLLSPISSLEEFKINNFINTNIKLQNEASIDDFKIEATLEGNETISLIPLMDCSIIILFNCKNTNGSKMNIIGKTLLNNQSLSYTFYYSSVKIFKNNSINLTYGYTSETNIPDYYNKFNGILGLSHKTNLTNFTDNRDKELKDTFTQLNISYIIFDTYYNNTTKKDKQNIFFEARDLKGNNIEFSHGFDILTDYNGWAIKIVAIFFDNKTNISRDGTRVELEDKYLVFEEGYHQSSMIMDNSTGYKIIDVYKDYKCSKTDEQNYYYIKCDKQFDMIIQIEDYGYLIPKSLIWDNNRLKINFMKEDSNLFYIYPNIHGLFYRKYSKENKDSYKNFLEPINKDDIIDLSGIWKIIFIIIVLLVVIIITIFVMRMMKKDTNESVDYNNMQQI